MIYIFIWAVVSFLFSINEEDYFYEKLEEAGLKVSFFHKGGMPGISSGYKYKKWIKSGGKPAFFVTSNWLTIRKLIHTNFYISWGFFLYTLTYLNSSH